mmetsp:Transcript_29314/g.28063  ORF Transcript_29314/g.28063 Transcript_29314/m.28063 type:complete len:427 (-) Transcript_29314:352-1632(-)|eukprot:CAMPEP_0119036942 /NCGR_PEP_ID=MMETSP1177-20130426/4985_1 /TAXON_ID=2985 /ORGANISM="Ochromonas sp, Strain CCMP1899" /LENGTH=426 /DNA_ID=CAMNT_0006997499 /DNA_START=97 /DNA_END=1377 /DNA_ORIENTATION=-
MSINNNVSYKKSPLKLLVSTKIGKPPSGKSIQKKRKVIEADKGIFDRLLKSAAQSMFDDDEDHSQLEITAQGESEQYGPEISDISMMDFSKDCYLVSALRSSEDRNEGSNKRRVSFCENLIQESSNINYNDYRGLLASNKESFKIDNSKQPIYLDEGQVSDQSFSDFFNHLDQDNSSSNISENLVNSKIFDTDSDIAVTYPQYNHPISGNVHSDQKDLNTPKSSKIPPHLEYLNDSKVSPDIDRIERHEISVDIVHNSNHLESPIVPFPVFISPTLAPPEPFDGLTASNKHDKNNNTDQHIDNENGNDIDNKIEFNCSDTDTKDDSNDKYTYKEEIDCVGNFEKVDEIIQKFSLFIVNVNQGNIQSNDAVNQFLNSEDLMVENDFFGEGDQNNDNIQTLENAVAMKHEELFRRGLFDRIALFCGPE